MTQFVYILPWWLLKLQTIGACLGALLLAVFYFFFGSEQAAFGYHPMALVWLFLGGVGIAVIKLSIEIVHEGRRARQSAKRTAQWQTAVRERPPGMTLNESTSYSAAAFAEAMRLYPNK